MTTRREANAAILAGAAIAAAPAMAAQALTPSPLPLPRKAGGKPLTEALKMRIYFALRKTLPPSSVARSIR